MTDRDSNGKFTLGNKASPGRPKKSAEEKYLKMVVTAMPQKDWRLVLERVKQLAMRGERWAVEFYADRIIGKPQQAVDLTSKGEQIDGDTEQTNRSLSALADAIRAGLSSEGAAEQSDMDTTEQTTVASSPDES